MIYVEPPQVGIVALRYVEPYYTDTVRCLEACGLPVEYVDRPGGVGSMTNAFNRGFARLWGRVEYVWFATDVTFPPALPLQLAEALTQDPGLWAVHPAHPSDHVSHQPDGSGLVKDVPYLEFTAAMVRADRFAELGGLDEEHWYWYQDLVFSKHVRDAGGRMAVHHGAVLGHVYRRTCAVHPATQQRYRMRRQRDGYEQGILQRKFGPDWKKVLWHNP